MLTLLIEELDERIGRLLALMLVAVFAADARFSATVRARRSPEP